MAVKPWLGAIKEPTNYKKDPRLCATAPSAELSLEYVFGYRSKDCRNNLKFITDDMVVYNTAGVGVVLYVKENRQSVFNKHIDDVTALDVNPA